jgi:hypothetical protein
MKITKSQLNKIIKEVLNEISGKQRVHDDKLARQKNQKAQKQLEAEELRQALGNDWQVNVRMLEGWYQLTVYKSTWAQEPGTNPQTMLDPRS